ncbi:hypothetical protein [Pyxidicoccus xibeiensis]|uniref:hypothetical protein n=1 Tax=Pyxidicoccus xibeiensis TaxID=2906759 RepID=UPI0020A799DC|nr:hypothetical protein [Pyxidicoccus xibeiensis]MCP3140641.1 hypothetical protein [Pyxidicoccus xibeiensis]
MERFVSPQGVICELEVRGTQLRIRTGARPTDEVTEVYASGSDALLAADFVRERWGSERYKPLDARPSLLTGAAPRPRPGGSLLLDASGTVARREPPRPLQRLQAADPWAGESKLAALEGSGLLQVLERQEGALVSARVQVSAPLAGPRTSPLKTLLKARAAQALRRLVVEVGHDEDDFARAVKVLGSGVPASLTSLTLCAFEVVEVFSATRGAPGAAYPSLGSVRHLALQAGRLELGRLALPALQSLHVRAGGLSQEAVSAVVEADWPELETLTLWFGSAKSGANVAAPQLAPLFSGERVPKLKHLRLQACEFADEAVVLLLEAPLLSRLESVDLSYGLLGDAGAGALLHAAPKLGGLRRLTVQESAVGPTARERLRALGPQVKVENGGHGPNDSVDHFVPSAAENGFVHVLHVG